MTNSSEDSAKTEKPAADDKLMRLKVKSPGVVEGDARLVSKSFALKFLRKVIVNARVQKLKDIPQAVRDGYKLDEHPGHEVWQVWSGVKTPLVEVVGPPEVLPFVACREVCRCKLNMELKVYRLPNGGVRLQATELPKPEPHEGHGKTDGAPCECLGTDAHDACAKAGCKICGGMDHEKAKALRAELNKLIDEQIEKKDPQIEELDEKMKAAGLTPVSDLVKAAE